MKEVFRKSTRFYVPQSDYDGLVSNPNADFVIECTPNKGNHPKGTYTIPNKVARQFIESKQGTHNWVKHENFKQDTVPVGLEEFFKSEKDSEVKSSMLPPEPFEGIPLTKEKIKRQHIDYRLEKEAKKEINKWVIIIVGALILLYLLFLNSCSERKESDCYCEGYEKVSSGGSEVWNQDNYDYNCLKWSKACQDQFKSN